MHYKRNNLCLAAKGCVPAPYERSSWGDSAPLPDDRGSSGDKGQGQGQTRLTLYSYSFLFFLIS